jgi:hypothetical protein
VRGPAPISQETLKRIAGLYAIEKEIRDRSAEERRTIRSIQTGLFSTISNHGCGTSLQKTKLDPLRTLSLERAHALS